MTNPMTCDDFAKTLGSYLESETDDETSARLEAHALECDDCGVLLADVRRISAEAGSLPELAPSRDLWAGIAARIETPIVELNSSHATPAAGRRERWQRYAWAGVAAAALVAVTATVTHRLTVRSVVAPVAQTAPSVAPQTPMTSVANRFAGEAAYDTEIARLRAILNERRPQLDTATIGVIEHNLAVIDEAIAQCKQALRRDPASRFLIESLHDELESKVQLLRAATLLSSRS